MSMDDVERELKRFQRDLEAFNSTLRGATGALQREHDRISSIWNDEFSREYQRRWRTFSGNMERYQKSDASRYESFIKSKVRQVGGFLRG